MHIQLTGSALAATRAARWPSSMYQVGMGSALRGRQVMGGR
jgi:hypothetical protein